LFLATWPSGKAEVCKTFITGSNPVVASKILALARPQGLFLFCCCVMNAFKFPKGERHHAIFPITHNCQRDTTFKLASLCLSFFSTGNGRYPLRRPASNGLTDWSDLTRMLYEAMTRSFPLRNPWTPPTPDKEQAYLDFIENVFPSATMAAQALKDTPAGVGYVRPGGFARMALVCGTCATKPIFTAMKTCRCLQKLSKLDNDVRQDHRRPANRLGTARRHNLSRSWGNI
jgi:hypothetical protein